MRLASGWIAAVVVRFAPHQEHVGVDGAFVVVKVETDWVFVQPGLRSFHVCYTLADTASV